MVLAKVFLKCCSPFQQRYVLAFAVFSGILLQMMHRLMFNLAITVITHKLNVTTPNTTECPYPYKDVNPTSSTESQAEFNWSSSDQAWAVGVFYVGYIITHVPGGLIADMYGPKQVFGYGVLLSGICSLITPMCCRAHLYAVYAMRIVMGCGQGAMFPAQSTFVVRWSLPEQRPMMNAYMNSGVLVGAVVGNALSGFLLSVLPKWDIAFYLYGSVTLMWYVCYLIFAYDSPTKHPFVTEKEKNRIMEAISSEWTENFKIKLGPILKSCVVWTMIIAELGHDWGFFIALTLLPQYMAYILHFDIKSNGVVSALPWVTMFVFHMIFSRLATFILVKKLMSKTLQCKIYLVISNMMPCVCFLVASYAGCSKEIAVLAFMLAMGFMGLIYSCLRVSNVDIAPNVAGFLMALMNGFGALCGIVGPPVFALFTKEQTVDNWRKGFYLSIAFVGITTVIYCIWGTSEVQKWNYSTREAESPLHKSSDTETPAADPKPE